MTQVDGKNTTDDTTPASYRRLFASGEYRVLFTADLLSVLGDQVATIALAVLVFDRSGSPLLAAAAYSLVYLPWLLGGSVLAVVADRWPRRRVMVGCDLARCGLIGLGALPAVPLEAVVVAVAAAAFLGPPFEAARGATLPQVLPDDRYVLASSVSAVTHQVGQLVGFVAGGSLIALTSTRGALAVDAATFLGSAALLRWGLRDRRSQPVAGAAGAERPSLWGDAVEGLRVVAGHREVRALLLLAWVVAMYAIVPEAIAVAYAAEMGLGPQAVGLLMGAAAAGTAAGGVALTRLVPPARRLTLMHPLALVGAALLLAAPFVSGLAANVLLFTLVGAFSACVLPARAAVMTAVPDELRGRVFSIAATGLQAGQVVAILGAGAGAQLLAPSTVTALAGVLALVAVGALSLTAPRRRTDPTPAPG